MKWQCFSSFLSFGYTWLAILIRGPFYFFRHQIMWTLTLSATHVWMVHTKIPLSLSLIITTMFRNEGEAVLFKIMNKTKKGHFT